MSISLNSFLQDAETAGPDDQARAEEGDVHALAAPFGGEDLGVLLGLAVFTQRRDRMLLGHRMDDGVAVDHVGGEVDEAHRALFRHRLHDVLRAEIIDRIEELVALGARHDRRQHLGRQVVDHVLRRDLDAADGARVGYVDGQMPALGVVRQFAPCDVGDDDALAVGDQLLGEMAADKAVAAEQDMLHGETS